MKRETKKVKTTLTMATLLFLAGLFIFSRCGEIFETDPFIRAYDAYLKDCAECHAPGKSTYLDVKNLNMSTAQTARSTLALPSDLAGNLSCNGQPYVIANDPNGSMLIAILDESKRSAYIAQTSCTPTYLSAMSMDPPPSKTLNDILEWINSGAQ